MIHWDDGHSNQESKHIALGKNLNENILKYRKEGNGESQSQLSEWKTAQRKFSTSTRRESYIFYMYVF